MDNLQTGRISGRAQVRIPVAGMVSVSNKPIKELRFLPFDEFPETGLANILYVDTTHNVIYYWNDHAFVPLSGGEETEKVVAKSTAQWAELTTLVSKYGVIYIYTNYRQEDGVDIPAMKVGDGSAYVVDLPFFDTGVTPSDRLRWDNKVSAKISPVDEENLLLYT